MTEKPRIINLTIRLPEDLHKSASKLNVDTGLSFQQLVINAIEQYVEQYQSGGKVETKQLQETPSPTEQDLMERLYRWTQPPYEDPHHRIMAEMLLKMAKGK